MNAEEAAARAREALALFNEGDSEAFAAKFAPDAEWWPLRSETEGVYRGPQGVLDWFRDTEELFEYIRAELGETKLIDGAGVSSGELHLRGKGSGATVDVPVTWVFRFDGDKVLSARAYRDRQEALAGLGTG